LIHNKQQLLHKSNPHIESKHNRLLKTGLNIPGSLSEDTYNPVGTVSLVLDLLITHERWGSRTDPTLNGHLHYPIDLDKPLMNPQETKLENTTPTIITTPNESSRDKIRKYHTDDNNNPPNDISFIPSIANTSGRLHSEFVRILFLQTHRETDRFFEASGVHLVQHDRRDFHCHRTVFTSQLKAKTVSILAKASTLRFILSIDGSPIISKSHTHPSHSETSLL
jgi:hypothetical protein